MYRQRTGPHPAGHPAGFFLRALAAAERDPGKSRARQSLPQKPLAFALPGPSVTRRRAAGSGPRTARGGARDRAAFAAVHGWTVGKTPAARSEPARSAGAAPRVPFSWLLLFGQAKRSDSSARMADEAHRDVSRFSRSAEAEKNQARRRPLIRIQSSRASTAIESNHSA